MDSEGVIMLSEGGQVGLLEEVGFKLGFNRWILLLKKNGCDFSAD